MQMCLQSSFNNFAAFVTFVCKQFSAPRKREVAVKEAKTKKKHHIFHLVAATLTRRRRRKKQQQG